METDYQKLISQCELCQLESKILQESNNLCKGHKVCLKCSKLLVNVKQREFCLFKSCYRKVGEPVEKMLEHTDKKGNYIVLKEIPTIYHETDNSEWKVNDSRTRSAATKKFLEMNRLNAFTTTSSKLVNDDAKFRKKTNQVSINKMSFGNNNSGTDKLSSLSKPSSQGQNVSNAIKNPKSKRFVNCPKCGHFFEYEHGRVTVNCESPFCKGKTEICLTCKKILEFKDYSTHFKKKNNIDVCITTLGR